MRRVPPHPHQQVEDGRQEQAEEHDAEHAGEDGDDGRHQAHRTKPGESAGCLLLQGGLAVSEDNADIPQEMARCHARPETVLRTRIACGAQNGELAEGADPAALARFVTAVANGMAIQAAPGATRQQLLETAELSLAAWPSAQRRSARKRRAPSGCGGRTWHRVVLLSGIRACWWALRAARDSGRSSHPHSNDRHPHPDRAH